MSWVKALKFSLVLSSYISRPRLSNRKINCTKPSCFRCFVAIWHRGSWVPTQKSKIKRLISDLPGFPGGKCRCLYKGFNRRSTSLKWPCQKSGWIIRITLTKKQITLAAQFPPKIYTTPDAQCPTFCWHPHFSLSEGWFHTKLSLFFWWKETSNQWVKAMNVAWTAGWDLSCHLDPLLNFLVWYVAKILIYGIFICVHLHKHVYII